MAEFAGDLNSFKPCLPFLEIYSNNELINHFGELNPSFLENPNLSIQSNMGFPNDNFLSQPQQEFPANFAINLPGFFSMDDSHANANAAPIDHSLASAEDSKKRKVMQVSDTSSGNSSTPVVENGLGGTNNKTKKKNTSGRRKRGRNNEKEVEKPKEVIHVRARRGQATDSHSLAKRVRREKINEKLRCLQDLVPGCYKVELGLVLLVIYFMCEGLEKEVDPIQAPVVLHCFLNPRKKILLFEWNNSQALVHWNLAYYLYLRRLIDPA